MERIFTRPKSLEERRFHFCPGCGHSLSHRLVTEAIDELDILGSTICVGSVGCAYNPHDYIACDSLHALHGRAPAVATAMKLALPHRVVFTYQGDGDLASIGMAESVHAAARGANFSVIFINNAVYGMTGGQMAPTTLLGQVTTTTRDGRDAVTAGFPIRVSELFAALDGPAYIERVALNNPANIRKAKRAVRKCFETQLAGKGFSMVEILSPCPPGWGCEPSQARGWLTKNMLETFPLGVFRDR
ncbi:MAG: 2-oxoglutarate oxidoreductase [Chloroflexota bacterium]|nr:MAG: 2-oxoglutarate oxidoreductase [Chloroflexota bacterium]